MLVNTFGGGTAALAKQIMFMKVSIFIEENPNITRRLFVLSGLILKLNLSLTNIYSKRWMKIKKTKAYDKEFLNMNLLDVNNLKGMSQDPQYEMEIMSMFYKIKVEAIKLTDTSNNPNIYEINSVRANKIDDCSTIRSNESIEPIPETVSTQQIEIHDQHVTNRKYRNSASIY